MPYGQVVTRSWKIIWERKFLLLLGVLASASGFLVNWAAAFTGNAAPVPSEKDPTGLEPLIGLAQGFRWLSDHLVLVLAIVAGFILISFLLWVLSVFFEAGLISATGRLDRDEPSGLRSSISEGARVFPRFLGLVVLSLVVQVLLVALAFSPLVAVLLGMLGGFPGSVSELLRSATALGAQLSDPSNVFLLIALLVLGLGLSVAISLFIWVVTELAARPVVIEKKGVFQSLGISLRQARRAPGRLLVTSLILIGIYVAAQVVVGVALLIPSGAASVISLALLEGAGSEVSTYLLIAALSAGSALLEVAAMGPLVAYNASYWTVAYHRLVAAALPDVAEPAKAPASSPTAEAP